MTGNELSVRRGEINLPEGWSHGVPEGEDQRDAGVGFLSSREGPHLPRDVEPGGLAVLVGVDPDGEKILPVFEVQHSGILPGVEQSSKVPVDVLAGRLQNLLEAILPQLQHLLQEVDGGGHVLDLGGSLGVGKSVLLELLSHQLPGVLGLLLLFQGLLHHENIFLQTCIY